MSDKYKVAPEDSSTPAAADETKGEPQPKKEKRKSSVTFANEMRDKAGAVEIVEEEWSFEHVKLLYMMSKYAVCARSAHDQESWIRSM